MGLEVSNTNTRLSSFFRNILILLSSIKIGIFRIILINQSVTLIAIKKLEHRVTTTPKTIHLRGEHRVGDVRPLDIPKSQVLESNGAQKGPTNQAAAMAKIMSVRGTSISVATNPKTSAFILGGKLTGTLIKNT